MSFLSEVLETVIKNGNFAKLKRIPPIILGGLDNKRGAPDEGIMIDDDDVDIEDGTASDGTIIYEWQTAIIIMWSSTKEDRQNLKTDLQNILKPINSGLGLKILGISPTRFIDNYGFEMRVRNCGDP